MTAVDRGPGWDAVEKATGLGGAVMLEHLAAGLGEAGIIGADRLRVMADDIRVAIGVPERLQDDALEAIAADFGRADEGKIRADERERVATHLDLIQWKVGSGNTGQPQFRHRAAAREVRRMS